jgi:hypothetical protein
MIKVDRFSGHVYTETEYFKLSDTGNTFSKCGDTWFGTNGEVIQERDDGYFNLKTGIGSSFGDPFEEEL